MATKSSTTLELEQTRHSQPPTSEDQADLVESPTIDENTGFSLPPADGGKNAWLVLFCCFMLEALIWGL
ncbi:hypothetical protein P154DRAFT_521176 [Amniculicola lignicola CBS 123094]|uniref:Uncharacterized protein n=1 Tax=Amniculicola lignicola CBS 123094 TaxID=1392246 RepID=A0A6A5WQB5_9PLEO|nr:hypothetical protein P154DRAFT_521176 [Amniculicola lignicola CBS 123094]